MTLTKTFISLLSIFTFFFSHLCNCQNTFEFTIKDTLTDQVINDAVELEDGSFILLAHDVFHEIIQSPRIEVNTRALPCGAYLWQIMNEDKVIEKGRWIKL